MFFNKKFYIDSIYCKFTSSKTDSEKSANLGGYFLSLTSSIYYYNFSVRACHLYVSGQRS